jgi:hypothetical protein
MSPPPTTAPAPARSADARPGTTGTAPSARGSEPGNAAALEPAPPIDLNAPWFGLQLGDVVQRIPLVGELVKVSDDAFRVDVERLGLAIPGLTLTELRLGRGADGKPRGGTLKGSISAPFVTGKASLSVDAEGNLSGGVENARFDVEVFGRPRVSFTYQDRRWRGGVTLEASAIKLPIPNVTVDQGTATVTFDGDQLTGSLTARFHHAALGEGDVSVTMTGAGVTGSGGFRLKVPLLEGSSGSFSYTDGKLAAQLALSAEQVKVPIPGFSLTSVNGNIALAEGHVNGSFGMTAAYSGIASLTLADVRVGDRGFAGGAGTVDVTAPALQGSRGTFRLDARGRPTGSLTIAARQIPIPALRSGSITVTLREDGGVDVAGKGRVEIGPVGGGDFTAGYSNGVLTLGADVNLKVPGLQPVTGRFDYRDGQLQGEVGTGVTVGPLSGLVTLRYRDQLFSGDGRLDYALGRFNGWVFIRVDGAGAISGEGEATFKLADWLTGTIALVVHPDLNVDARGELVVPTVELFKPWEFEKSFFNFEQEFPLWGITIPVVGSIGLIAEINASAGFRANFGPGTFSNIKAAGEISTRPDSEPAFTISGDLVIPAGAEIILTIGGGIGLSVLVAKISGGINLSGIAGVYGAITLTPTFAYQNGEYMLRGEALLQAAAQLKARINAYARVVAGIGWLSGEVWRKDWKLAEWRFDTGWHVGVKAGIEQVLGRPFEPKLSFDEVEVDPEKLIKQAMPKSGEPIPAPPAPPAPVAQFVSPDPQPPAEATPPPAGTPAAAEPATPPAQAAVPGAPAGGPEAAQAPGPAGEPPAVGPEAGAAAPEETVDPPEASTEPDEERSAEETHLVYAYDNLSEFLRRRTPTAPSDRELVDEAIRQAEEEPERAAPVPLGESSKGKPLGPELRADMEQAFGEDLAHVRVHTDESSRESARAVGAEAFTSGSDIFFGPSRDPEAGDAELLAHELTHVVQKAGDGSNEVSRPTDELEREADEAARAVSRGEQPEPIEERKGRAGIHRKADDGQSVSASAHVKFGPDKWKEVQAKFASDPVVKAALAKLESLEDVKKKAKDRVWDEAKKQWVPRSFVPMHFPGRQYLAHRSVTGEQQIAKKDYLVRAEGMREDTEQSKLSRLMYSETASIADPGDPWFTKSQRGEVELPTKAKAWQEYSSTQLWLDAKEAKALNHHPDLLKDPQQTSESVHNLTLSETGFGRMWENYWFAGGKWRRRAQDPEGGADVDANTKAIMVADYEAHHVIPLWLRSGSGRADGDQLANLAPWHKTAHQANHAVHHKVPKDVEEATEVTDYRHFNAGTNFLIHEWVDGNPAHPDGAPSVKLSADEKWATNKSGPIWMG